jgi:HK97 gp10 family phage protein
MSDFHFKLDLTNFKRRAGLANRAWEMLVRQVTEILATTAYGLEPKTTGNMAHGTTVSLEGGGADTKGIVKATAPYAVYVHEGTGIYGPLHRAIVAAPGHAFLIPVAGAVEIPGKPGFIFRTRIAGMKPNPFFKRAAEAVIPRVPEIARGVYRKLFGAGGGE